MSASAELIELLIKENCITSDKAREVLRKYGLEKEVYLYLSRLRKRGIIYVQKFGRRRVYCIYPSKKAVLEAILSLAMGKENE